MKIGIVTYHRAHNYGAVMQALATRFVLEEMGHEVYYVDYWPDYHKEMYALFPRKRFKKFNILQKAKFLLLLFIHYKSKKRRINNFEAFFKEHIYPYCRPVEESYDIVIYGSDQIWRKQKALGTYNPFYFGQNDLNAKRHISYAASMGIITYDESDKQALKKYLSHLNYISVRETDLKKLVEELGYNCVQSLDPSLLLNRRQWYSLVNIQPDILEKYVLYYKLQGNSFVEQELARFALKRNLKLITLYGEAKEDTEDNLTTASPLRMLSLINGAEFVFTSSYHGLAFSIIFHKPFYAAFMKNSGRARSLLSELNLLDRLLEPNSLIPRNESVIDFEKTDRILESKRKPSLEYLRKSISEKCM